MNGMDVVAPWGGLRLPRITDEEVEEYLRESEKRLQALLSAPPTQEELAAEEALDYLDEDFWERRGIWGGRRS